ncbi:MAG: flagellar hook-basal body complex protein FliE [Lachnospiraceae bacterium]|nr:flagellar hook-basal body complex protein FliE [Lachnospiraceae bacterium]
MVIKAANDIDSFYNISSDAVKNALYGNNTQEKDEDNIFSTFLDAAVHNINDTNIALSNQENEILKWSMGISENPHDLTIAAGKADAALSYTVALRDKLLEAYKEIMQMQI